MKKLIFLLVMAFLLSGCGSTQKMVTGYNNLMKQVPNNEFSRFEYHRSGMYSSAHIVAKEGAKDGNLMMIQSLNIQLNYGPENLTIALDGFTREVSK